ARRTSGRRRCWRPRSSSTSSTSSCSSCSSSAGASRSAGGRYRDGGSGGLERFPSRLLGRKSAPRRDCAVEERAAHAFQRSLVVPSVVGEDDRSAHPLLVGVGGAPHPAGAFHEPLERRDGGETGKAVHDRRLVCACGERLEVVPGCFV